MTVSRTARRSGRFVHPALYSNQRMPSPLSPFSTIPAANISDVPAAAHILGVEEHRLTVNAIEWRYQRAGSGPALLLVHGLMGYSWSWRFNLRELAQHFTVYAPDLPGTGFSQRGLIIGITGKRCRWFDFADGRSRRRSVPPAGLVSRRRSRDRPRRTSCAARLAPPDATHDLVCADQSWSSFGRQRVRWLAAPLGRHFVIHVAPRLHSIMKMYYRDLYGDPARIAPGSIEGYEAGLVVPRSFHHLVRIMRGWHPDLRQIESTMPLLQELPTLLLWGSRDRVVYPSSASQLQDRLSNSTMLVMEGVGHLPYEELPMEFNQVVCEFLLRGNPRTPRETAVSYSAFQR